ncbi:MAG: transglycosylase SLT domain-containing protein [Burkholderiales bacterium]
MIFRYLLTIALALASAVQAAPPQPRASDEPFLKAYDAYRAGDPVKLAKHSAGLEEHVLAPYLEFWRLRMRLDELSTSEAREFLSRQAGSYLADRLRSDWLKALGRRSEWQTFDLELAPLVQDDLEIRCYAWLSRLARNDDGVYEEARAMWLEPKELPEGCTALAEKMINDGRLRVKDVWQRARVLFDNGQLSAAQRVLDYLPADEAPDPRLLSQAAASPERLLAAPPADLARRQVREMVLFAIMRLARSDPRAAADLLGGSLGERLPEPDRLHAWVRVAYEAARRHMPDAVKWYRRGGRTGLSDEQLAWKARAALRAGDWQMVREAIDPMSVTARQDPAWSYWYGRALGAEGNAEGARAYFLRVSGQPHFYGLLSAEELGETLLIPQPFHSPPEDEVAQARNHPGLARALALYGLVLRTEGMREWLFSIRHMDDRQLLAAAELARRAEVYDRAINTADRTAHIHNFQVRFLAPFRDVFREHARAFDLEEAWVLGIARQESRFIADAKSSAGARGLMQLMPATARWVAGKIGMQYSPERVIDIETNVTLGTRYLKYVLEDLGHPVLASAAYNAGPGRARRWRDLKPLEGAIYAETIPFNETRDYVKRVMANTLYYAALHGGKPLSLKQRLGTIPAKAAGDRFNESLP